MTKRTHMFAALLLFVLSNPAAAQPRNLQLEIVQNGNLTNANLVGEGSYITVLRAVADLRRVSPGSQKTISALIESDRETLPPPFYIEAARLICATEPDKARNWLALYSIRARYDAGRCLDKTAASNVQATLLHLQIPGCAAHLGDRGEHIKALQAVVDDPRTFASSASPWWICSGGMDLMIKALDAAKDHGEKVTISVKDEEWLKPQTEWAAVEQTIRDQVKNTPSE